MFSWEIWFAIVPGLVLFLYGIEHFSKEIQKVAGERFRSVLGRLTNTSVGGALLGALVTGLIQSSTATTVIAVALVNAGTISFAQSLGIMFGANVGTTVTAQLIAFKVTGFAPFFIVLGFLISIIGGRYRFIGKPLFYFGLVFFSLALVSDAIVPIKDDPATISLFSQLSNAFLALLAGILLTILLQSSSVVTGMVVLLAASGLLGLGQAIPIILGSNIGTTATSLIAASRMDLYAKRASAAHFLFNLGGVLIFLPFLVPFEAFVADIGGTAAQQVANAHLLFNVTAAFIFLLILEPFKTAVERLVPGQEEEILFTTKYLNDRIPSDNQQAFTLIEKEILNSLDVTLKLFEESAGFIDDTKNHRKDRIAKLESLNDFLDERIEAAILQVSKRERSKAQVERTVVLVRISNAIEQLGDVGEDFGYLTADILSSGVSFSQESKTELKQIYAVFRSNLLILKESLPFLSHENIALMRKNDVLLRGLINKSYKHHLARVDLQKSSSGSYFVEAVSLIEYANSNVREIRKLLELYGKLT